MLLNGKSPQNQGPNDQSPTQPANAASQPGVKRASANQSSPKVVPLPSPSQPKGNVAPQSSIESTKTPAKPAPPPPPRPQWARDEAGRATPSTINSSIANSSISNASINVQRAELVSAMEEAVEIPIETPSKIAPNLLSTIPVATVSRHQAVESDYISENATVTKNVKAKLKNNQKQVRPNFKVKAALQAIALGLVPVVALGTTAYIAINRSVAQEIATTQKDQAVQSSEMLNRFMKERLSNIQVLATLPVLRNPAVRDMIPAPDKQQILEQLKATFGVYNNIVVFDLNGNPILQTAGGTLGNQLDRDYFQAVLKTNQPAIGTPQTSEFSSVLSLPIAAPVQDGGSGQIIAVVMAQLPVSQLETVVKSDRTQQNPYYIFDQTGKVFLASDPAQINQNIDTSFPTIKDLQASKQPNVSISPLLSNGFTLLQTIGKPETAPLDAHLIGYANTQSTSNSSIQWGVVSAANSREVVTIQNRRVSLLSLATLGAVVLVAAIAALSARRASGLIEGNLNELQNELDELQEKQARSSERSRLLSEIVNNMRQSLRQEDILNKTVSELRYALNTDRVIVYFFESDWCGTVVAESAALGCPKILGEKVNDPLREGMIERYRNGRVRFMNNIYTENLTKCHQDILEGFQIKASIVAPIVQSDKLIGLLCAHQCSGPRQWEVEDVDLFAKLASQLGYVLDQASLIEKQTRSADRSRLLNEIVVAMRRSLKEEDILQTTVSELRYALNCDRVIVYRFQDDWNGTIIAESVALGWRKILHEKVVDPFREGLIERYRNGRVRVMNDIFAENLTRCHMELLEGFQIKASIVAPILRNGELIGLLCAHHCAGPKYWQEEDVDLFAKLSIQLGFALDQASLMSQQTRSADRSRLLNEIVASMRRSLKAEEILNITVSELRYALHTDRVIVYRFEDDWNGTIIAESVASGRLKVLGEKVIDPFREGLIERYRNGRVRYMNDIYTENLTKCHQELLENFQIRASIVAPIIQNKQLIGLLCAHHCTEARYWAEEEVDLFAQLAIQLGFALDQADLLEYTEKARQEARQEADAKTQEQRQQKEFLQQRALELLREVEPVSRGDLTVRARVTPDEVGTIAESYNTIIKSLRQIVEQVQGASKAVAETATSNETAVSMLSKEANYQLHSISGALQQIQEMVDSIQGVAERARKAETSVQLATQALQAGDEAMDRTVSGISTIRETVATTAKKVKRLGEASQKISRVVSLINGFAAQTNLLALNAAVEASRAGEEGKGFKVVAEEVRSLAQQSATATAEIAQLVEEIQSQTNEVVMAMESGTEQVVAGTQLVEASRNHLSQISTVSSQINKLVKEIAQAAAVQTQTSTGVSLTMEKVAAIADQTSQQSDIVANSFADLLQVAKTLQVSIAQFKVKD